MKAIRVAIVVVIVVSVSILYSSLYTVREGEQVVITQFGDPVGVETDAGLYFKKPFIQEVNRFEKRLLPWDGDPESIQTGDKKRIEIDIWARWRITKPKLFFQRVQTQQSGQKILDDVVDSSVRNVVASNSLIEVVRSSNRKLGYETEELADHAEKRNVMISLGRTEMEKLILEKAGAGLEDEYGIELVDVHFKRVNYAESIRRTVHERMISERMRIAQLFESEAQEERNRILGQTQKLLDQIQGEMEQKSAEIRGEADAEVIRIAAEAYSQSPEFYAFLRRLEAYRNTLAGGTRLILSTDNAFLKQFNDPEEGNPDYE